LLLLFHPQNFTSQIHHFSSHSFISALQFLVSSCHFIDRWRDHAIRLQSVNSLQSAFISTLIPFRLFFFFSFLSSLPSFSHHFFVLLLNFLLHFVYRMGQRTIHSIFHLLQIHSSINQSTSH
ncbi:hypothetical protein PENTCL1PPCAC_11291, partial [Pristionchus entomophagus]